MGNWKTIPLAALLLGSVAMALPAAAASPGRTQQTSAAATAQAETARAKADKPLVMLVCRETQAGRNGANARASGLTCVTRWAGL